MDERTEAAKTAPTILSDSSPTRGSNLLYEVLCSVRDMLKITAI
jgi:hypothetical protein